MGFLNSLTEYGAKWEKTDEWKLSKDEEFKNIQSASVVSREQDWGTSVSICLLMKGGGTKYIPLSRDSELSEGDNVDLNSITITELERDGVTIYRADGNIAKSRGRSK